MKAPTKRYRLFEPATLFYHVTRPEHLASIERDGLRADADGNIFAFTDLIVADTIAAEQVFADPYALLWIAGSGIKGRLYADDVAESCRQFQCIIRQDRIDPRYVHYLATMTVQRDALTPWQRLRDANRGITRQQSEAMFREAREAQNRGRQ